MTQKIHLLTDNIVNKIAAGEVVERPASVVKELVENSIDAGASKVHVSILAGGKQSIVVSDNGQGMSKEDVKISYMRHATSKMHSPSDLFNISTLGFRGEALASIGAVSFMTIETRYRDQEEGTRLVIEGGIERDFHAVGRAVGTTISVRQLFFNTPARRKFLRHVDTEARHITRTMIHLAAAYPQVGFELDHQDRNVLRFKSSTPVDRALDLLGIEKRDSITFKGEKDGISVDGIMSSLELSQKSKNKQYLIVRGRPIYARILSDAIYKGCSGLIPESAHPSYLCWLDLDPRQVDVNVHPTKREIRIADERGVADIIQQAVRQSVGLSEEDRLVFDNAESASFEYPPRMDFMAPESSSSSSSLIRDQTELANKEEGQGAGEERITQGELPLHSGGGLMPIDTLPDTSDRQYEQVWQAHDAYLICPLREALLVVDQYAAHQRILYEEACAEIPSPKSQIQQLLFPLVLKLGREEFAMAQQMLVRLLSLGFDMREFGENTYLVEGIPLELKNWDEGSVLRRVLADLLAEKTDTSSHLHEILLLSYARHAAVGEGRKLDPSEMKSIVSRLMACDEPYVCPRGKPTMVKVLRRDLDKLFGKA